MTLSVRKALREASRVMFSVPRKGQWFLRAGVSLLIEDNLLVAGLHSAELGPRDLLCALTLSSITAPNIQHWSHWHIFCLLVVTSFSMHQLNQRQILYLYPQCSEQSLVGRRYSNTHMFSRIKCKVPGGISQGGLSFDFDFPILWLIHSWLFLQMKYLSAHSCLCKSLGLCS